MRLMIVASSLVCGGAEKLIAALANAWTAGGSNVTIATMDDGPSFFPLLPAVNRVGLGLLSPSPHPVVGVARAWRRIRRLREVAADVNPDVFLSFNDQINVLSVLAARLEGKPAVICDQVDPALHGNPWHWKAAYRATYPMADALVVQTERARSGYPARLKAMAEVIPNAVFPLAPPDAAAAPRLPRPHAVSVGRLVRQKGFDLLLRAFARLPPAFGAWQATIFGDGPLRGELEALRDSLGLAGRVHMPGFTRDVSGALGQGDLFLFPSRFEGMPNALGEAMLAGLPVIAADCPSGPREMIRDGESGLLVPVEDVEGLTDAMARAMGDEPLRRRLAAGAPAAMADYSFERIFARWNGLLERVIRGGKR